MMSAFSGRKVKVLATVLTAHEESAFPKTLVVIYFIGYYTSLLGPVSSCALCPQFFLPRWR